MEKGISAKLLPKYETVLSGFKGKDSIKILDIGGAGGNFALSIKEYFDNTCDITVIDNMKFKTWDEYSTSINFIETSVDDIDKLFKEETFDIIFSNRVFHHFVRKNWKETLNGMNSIMKKIYQILKKDGYFCVTDHFFDGILFDKISSLLVYVLSSCTFKPVVKICKKMGVESAGTGVCFLSYNMWNKLLYDNNFSIEVLERSKKERVKAWYKKIIFLNRSNTLDNTMIIKRS